MRKRVVAVMGAGVGGLTAAHELAERDFEVHVFENSRHPGGKARSMGVPNSGTDGRPDLPGEHGFRFFPGFYRHVPDTMRRIPYGAGTVLDNLVPTTRITVARAGADEIVLPTHLPTSPSDLQLALETALLTRIDLSPSDIAHFVRRLMVLLTSCEGRRFGQFEHQSWWEFSKADDRTEGYKKFLADGLTRTLVAAKAREMSARTGGYILLQLLFDMARIGNRTDRVLNGPTSDVWINPWVRHLERLGVRFYFDSRVTDIKCAGQEIYGITVRRPWHERVHKDETHPEDTYHFDADYYVAAVPVEVLMPTRSTLGLNGNGRGGVLPESMSGKGLVTENDDLKKAEPRLEALGELQTRWMNGIQFYFRTDAPLERGHAIYIDSPWALTSISQQQFWPGVDLGAMGDGEVRGILSVDVSDWEKTGGPASGGKPAMQCSEREIILEVWAQLTAHLNDDSISDLVATDRVTAFLDPDIHWPNPACAVNLEPLLVNTAGSWEKRPTAHTEIENLFLAADYVQTNTDLATMEGANEAARRAVNAILCHSGSWAPKCKVWELQEPPVFAPARQADRLLYGRLPNLFDLF